MRDTRFIHGKDLSDHVETGKAASWFFFSLPDRKYQFHVSFVEKGGVGSVRRKENLNLILHISFV